MGSRKPYSISNAPVICGGFPLSGLASDEPFTVEPDEDEVEWIGGVDGNGQFVRSVVTSATGTIVTEYGSSANDVLETLRALGEPFPIFCADQGSNGTRFESTDCMITKSPALVIGKSVKELSWPFKAGRAKITHASAKEV